MFYCSKCSYKSNFKNKFKFREIPNAKLKIENYFKELIGNKLGEKYAKNFN